MTELWVQIMPRFVSSSAASSSRYLEWDQLEVLCPECAETSNAFSLHKTSGPDPKENYGNLLFVHGQAGDALQYVCCIRVCVLFWDTYIDRNLITVNPTPSQLDPAVITVLARARSAADDGWTD